MVAVWISGALDTVGAEAEGASSVTLIAKPREASLPSTMGLTCTGTVLGGVASP